MCIKKVFLFIFNRSGYLELLRIEKLDSFVPDFLIKLSNCCKFQDLLEVHKEMVEKGFDFDTGWNFNHIPIKDVKLTDLVFMGDDRDTTICGHELEYLENNEDDDDWLNWSYWASWKWYYNTLFKRIKHHRNPMVEIKIKTPHPRSEGLS